MPCEKRPELQNRVQTMRAGTRSRINTLAHQAGQRYGLQRRDELTRLVEAQGRTGLTLSELETYLDTIEHQAAS